MRHEIWLLLFVLATYRLAELVAKDFIFDSTRRWIAKRAATGSGIEKFVADLVHCPLCLGVWFSLLSAYAYDAWILKKVDILLIPLWLGIAGAQYLLSKISQCKDQD